MNNLMASELPEVPGYSVLREIARGGMGRVFAAYDLMLERDVALKVLLPGANSDRFIRESKITARLPHPCIPPVHALGTLADGSPFLAMKLVGGQTLAAEMKTANRMQLLQAFTQVCQAVGFAHSREIIHRDLKPANVMVGAFGEVQVMDWGLAKDLTGTDVSVEFRVQIPAASAGSDSGVDRTIDQPSSGESTDVETQAGTVLGTPAYISPEVAAGNAATKAADIYGLGAILYTLLSGRPPYSGQSIVETLHNVTHTEPSLFVEPRSSVPQALVAICRTAMARNPEARYASAEDIGRDVTHWLSDEPVSVYREPWSARVARWARGRKTTVVAAAVLLLTTAIAASVAAVLVWMEQRETKVQWDRAEGEKITATQNADAAKKVVYDLSRYIQQVELAPNRQAVTDPKRKDALDQALPGYERLLELHPNDERLRSTIAQMHRFRANLCRVLSDMPEAERSYRVAFRLFGELAADTPIDSAYRFDHALVGRDFSLLFKSLGRLSESAEILQPSIGQLEKMWQADPKVAERQRTLAMMLLDQAELDYQLGHFGETEQHARRATELQTDLADKSRQTAEGLQPLFHGMSEIRLAIALRELGRFDEALIVHNKVLKRFEDIIQAQSPAMREYLLEFHRAQAERGVTLTQMPNRRDTALPDLDSAIVGFESLAKKYPQLPSYLRSQGMATLYRGRLKAILTQREATVQDLNAAARIFESMVAKYPDVPIYQSYLGQTFTALGQLDSDPTRSAEWYRKAREMHQSALKRSPENAQDRKALTELDALAKGSKP